MTAGAEHAPGAQPASARSLIACALVFILVGAALLGIGWHRGATDADLLRGPDDMMRMLQVLDWQQGQAWTDTVQRRLDPPDGVRMHWSRLADLPLAAAMAIARWFVDADTARFLAILLTPPFLGGLFAAAFVWAGLPLAGRAGPLVPTLLVFALALPLEQFHPGRVDHHGLQLLLTAIACGCLVRAVAAAHLAPALWLGILGGVSLAIGLEALVWLGATALILGLLWAGCGGTAARPIIAFGAALATTTTAAIVFTLPPGLWAVPVCDRASIVHVVLAASIAVVGLAARQFDIRRPDAGWPARLAVATAMGGIGLAALALSYPECAGSPYGAMPEDLRFWLGVVAEAKPLAEFLQLRPGGALSYILLPGLTCAALAWWTLRGPAVGRAMGLTLTLLTLAGLLFVVWQVRGVNFAMLFAALGLVPLSAALDRGIEQIRGLLSRAVLRVAIPAVLLAVILTPNLLDEQKPAVAERREGCDIRHAVAALRDAKGLGRTPITMAAPIFVGVKLLYYTPHAVLAAPYHRNVRGLPDNRLIFSGGAQDAAATIRRRKVGAILFCKRYARLTRYRGQAAWLSRRLAAGRPPDWLALVMAKDGLSLYRVLAHKLPPP